MSHRIAYAAPVAAAFVLVIAACRGCTSTDAPGAEPAPDASADSLDAKPEKPPGDTVGGDLVEKDADAAIDVPMDGVPAGWQPWIDWSPECPIFVPGPGAQMPEPIEWEPCPSPVAPEIACSRMKCSWGGPASPFPGFWRDPSSGAALLYFSRRKLDGDWDRRLRLIAEADGVVRVAHLQTDATSFKCQFFDESIGEGRYVVRPMTRTGVKTSDGGAGDEHGLVGAPIGVNSPQVLIRQQQGATSSNWRISSDWIIELNWWMQAWTWDGKPGDKFYQMGNDPDGLQPHVPVLRGSDVFFSVGNLNLCGVMSWNPKDGLRPLLRKYGDQTWAAGNLGTDGKDMVWTQKQGSGACTTDTGDAEIWTAPHTTDPDVLKASAHRLRSDLMGMTAESFAVGFGYAAHLVQYGDPASVSVEVVSLSDGYRWVIVGKTESPSLHWGAPLGFTEQELFIPIATQDICASIARIRLDSLGPGTPPD